MRRIDRIKLVAVLSIIAVVSLRLGIQRSGAIERAQESAPAQHLDAASTTGVGMETQRASQEKVPPRAGPAVSDTVASSPPPSPLPITESQDKCFTHEHTEYDGQVVMWGPHNVVETAAECCEKCRAHRERTEAGSSGEQPCTVWVFCAQRNGCATQKFGECWGKAGLASQGSAAVQRPKVRAAGEGIPWVSGAVFTPAEAAAVAEIEAATKRAITERRERPDNPRVFFEVDIEYSDATGERGGGRIEFVLYRHEAPRAAENFRAMCTGEKGGRQHYKGMNFYRIIDMFIDQSGAGQGSIWGGSFDDDPGGLALRHERPGLLSAANMGPDTNSGHFSIVVAPAPHLDGGYTIFGEVTSGMDVVMAINKLDKYRKGKAIVKEAGCLANCEPRPEVTAKCAHRASESSKVQGKPVHACID